MLFAGIIMEENTYSVEVLGFSQTERAVLTSIFSLSARRSPKFVRHEQISKFPDMYLVDTASEQAIASFKERNAAHHAPAVLIGDNDYNIAGPILKRPMQWAKLFKAFDTVVAPPSAEPLAKSPHPAPIASLRQDEQAIPPPADRMIRDAECVLVVDDNRTVREFMKIKLAPFGFNVDYAESGEQAVELSQGKHYTCVFLDVIMPGINGYEVCKIIKSRKSARKTSVVMLTSKDTPFDKIRGMMAGCDAYLTKPVDEEKLLETIVKFLPQKVVRWG